MLVTRAIAGAVLCLLAVAASPGLRAQELEPRAYSNTPTGLNFLLAGYGYTEGNQSFDPSVPIEDADLRTNSAILAWARSLGVRGRSAKVDIVMPYTWLSGTALFEGQPRRREVSGFADPRFRYSVNLYGAPALSLQEFSGYKQDVIIGLSLQVSVPVGQYDDTKLVNIGTNRWAFKPELGISKSWGQWTVDVAAAVAFYTDNTDFLDSRTVSQEPLYAVQGHIVHGFRSGIWLALDGTYYWGGRTEGEDLWQHRRVQPDWRRIRRPGDSLAVPLRAGLSPLESAATGDVRRCTRGWSRSRSRSSRRLPAARCRRSRTR